MTLAHDVSGTGPTLVLVHGVCHRRHAWDAVVPLLTDHFRVVTVDLPGHGDSPAVPDAVDAVPYCLDLLADFVGEITPEGERAHVAGNSLGGYAALEMGNRGLAASVTAISPAGFFRSAADQRRAIGVFRALRAVTRPILPAVPAIASTAAGRALFMSVFCAKPWRYPREALLVDGPALVTNTVVDRGLEADFAFSTPVEAARDVPVTVLWGRRDRVLPVAQAAGVHAVFPQARIEITPDGHVPMTDDPHRVADAIAATAGRAR